VSHVTADFAFNPQSLFFGCFGEFSLERIFLSAVASFFSFMVAFAFRQGSTLSSLVQGDRVNLVNLASRTERPNFFRNIHVNHYQLCNRENIRILILFLLFQQESRLVPPKSDCKMLNLKVHISKRKEGESINDWAKTNVLFDKTFAVAVFIHY
jgi:transcriptional antiterminator